MITINLAEEKYQLLYPANVSAYSDSSYTQTFFSSRTQTCPTEARQAVQAVRRTRVHPRMIIHLRRRSTPTLQVIARNYQSG